ncbi:MAG TPA: LPS export ABC transporter periplasmic protein LptC [Xanthobacteraceae bacterium]|nr:LPS export ABC transporter periplasmic protein LptC [Xanthobacteraceae bacterium]
MNRLTPLPGTAPRPALGLTSASSRDFDRAFRNAARHSSRVRLLRVAVPATVVLAVTAAALAAWYNPLRLIKLPITGTLGISGTRITMQLPRLSGFTRDSRAYQLTAQTADQDLTRPDAVELKGIAARVQMQDQTTVEMSAAAGLYNTKADTILLHNDVRLKSSNGYEARLTDALVDMHSGHVISQQPVEVKLLNGVLNAKGIEVIDSGNLIRFDGGVVMDMTLAGATGRAP